MTTMGLARDREAEGSLPVLSKPLLALISSELDLALRVECDPGKASAMPPHELGIRNLSICGTVVSGNLCAQLTQGGCMKQLLTAVVLAITAIAVWSRST